MTGHDFFTYDGATLVNIVFMDAGEIVPEHNHAYPHDCFVTKGTVRFVIASIAKDLEAPSTAHFPDGAVHGFTALTDAIVICTHPADKALK